MTDRIADIVDAAADSAPPALAKYIKALAPVISAIVKALEVVWPYYWWFFQSCYAAYRVLPKDTISAIIGLVFCFFGGLYPMLFAAIEAARHTGWDTTVAAITELTEQAKIVAAENKKDDDVDADGDGVKDVKQIDAKALLMRKTKLVLTTSNPEKINTALAGLYTSWLSVVSVLKIQFARTIMLALTIADLLKKPCDLYLIPALKAVVPPEYHRWLPITVGWACKTAGMSVAFYIQRIISAFSSAVRGGLQTARALLRMAAKRGLWEGKHEDTYIDEALGWTLALIGFYFQYSLGFSVPWPFNWVLWPFEASEYYIMWAVTSPEPVAAPVAMAAAPKGFWGFGR